jgi:hypothetical protein
MPRFAISAPVDWCVEGTLTRSRSTTRDVSDSGLLVDSITPVAVGAAVELFLGERRIRLRGRVARSAPLGFAVELSEPKSAGRRRLRRHLKSGGWALAPA